MLTTLYNTEKSIGVGFISQAVQINQPTNQPANQ
jgi:hypothetical protein